MVAVFDGVAVSRNRRNEAMRVAVAKYGCGQKEASDHPGLHYSTVSHLLNSLTSGVEA